MKGLKIMASVEEDSDIAALRLQALATIKTRPQSSTHVISRPSRPDAELEDLRTAALHSKRGQDDHLQASRNLPKHGFVSNRGYRRDFGHSRNAYSRVSTNLIVIQPVPLEENLQQTSSTLAPLMRPQDRYCSILNEDDASQSPRQQKAKSTGKFSRFESDSSGEDSSESEFSESEDAKSQESSGGSEKKSEEEEESCNEENTNDDENEESNDILLLHAEEQLQEADQLLDYKEENENLIHQEAEHACDQKVSKETNLNVAERNGSIKSKEFSDNNRTKGDASCAGLNSMSGKLKSRISRNSDNNHESNRRKDEKDQRNKHRNKDNVKKRMEHISKDGRSVYRGGDEERDDRHTPRVARRRNRENDEGRRKERDRQKLDEISDKARLNVRDKHRRKGEENKIDAKADKNATEMESNNRKIRSVSGVGETKVRRIKNPREGQQNSRPAYRESGSVSKLRSPSPSSKSQPVLPSDLRQKLKSRSSKNDVVHDGVGSKRQEHPQRDSGNSSSEEQSSGRVKSVLSVVKLSSSEPKTKSSRNVRSKLESPPPPPPPPLASLEKGSRKPLSPVRCDGDQSPRMRKVLIVKEGKSFSDDDNRGSKRTRINITLTEAPLENDESTTKQRVPVRLRLGNIPKSSKSTSKPDPVQISHHHHHHSDRGYRSSSPSFVSKSIPKKRPSPSNADTDDPPRKVKLKRDAFLSTAKLSSSSKINGFPSKKSHNESGKTYENELDEKIRRIRAKNQAIMKRKCEIDEDEQVNY